MDLNEMQREEDRILRLVDDGQLMKHARHISSWIRITGTKEEWESLQYIQTLLDSFGYETQMLTYDGYLSFPKQAQITIQSSQNKSFPALGICFTPSTGEKGITGETVEENQHDLNGKILLSDGLGNASKIKEAQSRGALAVLFIQDEHLHNCPASDIWGTPLPEQLKELPQIPAISITREAGDLIRSQMKQGPVLVSLVSLMVNHWSRCPILTADLPCSQSRKFVLFSGHIDSWDYGAMDNAAANSVMIECARLIAQERHQLKRGIRLAFWSGHSQGKYAGSAWYADHHFEELEENCVCHVNIDSVGGKGAVVVEEPPVMAQAWNLARSVVEKQVPCRFKGKRMALNCDQSFLGIGVTSVFGTFSEQDISTAENTISFRFGNTNRAGGLGWWWHTSEDTMDKLNLQFLLRDCRIYLSLLWRLLTSPVLPYSITQGLQELKDSADHLKRRLEGRFNLSPLNERLSLLMKKTEEFDEQCRKAAETSSDSADLALLEELQLSLCRNLVRIAYHKDSIFQFDRCGKLYPIPSLACGEQLADSAPESEDSYLYAAQLQRGLNRVMAYLKRMQESFN